MHTLITNARIINEGISFNGCVWIDNQIIREVFPSSELPKDLLGKENFTIIDAQGKLLIPGIIDDQVHFREPGLTEKGDIHSESRAAAAGGVTSFMEMPNTRPPAVSIAALEEKYAIAAHKSLVNYSFYLGATNENINEVKQVDPKIVCGVKVFMGSSTGNMLVDNEKTLSAIFAESPILVATHCEDEQLIVKNNRFYKEKYGSDIAFRYHPLIRSAEACYRSSAHAVELAHKYNTQLHVLHLSTERELSLFATGSSHSFPRITAEACVHHLWFTDEDYDLLGARIKCNPAIKTATDRAALRDAVNTGRIRIVATDHAPHTKAEKQSGYFTAPSGLPLVQHSLVAMLELYHQGIFSLETIVDRMCHSPALLFKVERRGFIKKGYYADLVLVDTEARWEVSPSNILYKWYNYTSSQFQSL